MRDRTICDLVKVGTDNNLSDIFTKILGPNKFESLCDRMRVPCSMPTPQVLVPEAKAVSKPQGSKSKANCDWMVAAPA